MSLTLAVLSNQARAENCAEKSGRDAIVCASAAYEVADQQLNMSYQARLTRLEGNSSKVTKLIADERAWIRKRDADCRELVKSFDLNPLDYSYSVATIDCLRRATEARRAQLKSQGR